MKLLNLIFFPFVVASFFFAPKVQATTAFYAGSYNRNLTWTTDTADTVVVFHNTVVQGQHEIMVEEGVVVLVRGRLTCSRIKALGTSANPIRIMRAPNPSFSLSVFEVNQRQGRDTALFRHVQFDTIRLNLRTDISYFMNCTFYGKETNLNAFDELVVDSCLFQGSESVTVLSAAAHLELKNSRFIENGLSSTTLYNVLGIGSSAVVEKNVFLNNTACPINVSGLSSVLIRNNTFKGNHSVRPAIYLASPASGVSQMSVMNNLIDSNIARDAGAMYIEEQVRGEVSHNVFSRNTSKRRGGAIHTTKPIENFFANTIINNQAYREGGGICADGIGGVMIVKSCLISNNTASSGGGIYHNSLDMVVVNSSIVNNSDTSSAGGIRTRGVAPSGLDIYNSIVRGNISVNGQNQMNAVGPPFNIIHSNVEGGYAGINNFDANPLFISPSASAGHLVDARNADWSLDNCNSPCINAGNQDTLLVLSQSFYDYTSSSDLKGNARISRGQIDVGALEADGNTTQGAFLSNPICSNNSVFSAKAAFSTNGTPNAITWQIDTGNGVWTTIIPILIPGLSINFDTLIATNLPTSFGNAHYRTISNYGCFMDTSASWSPGITPATFSSESIEICSTDSVFLQGDWRRQSGVFYDTLVNAGGCDSVHTINLTVYPSYDINIFDTICKGESYLWNGTTYNNPGTYNASFVNGSPLACDSNVTLHLAEYPELFSVLSDTIFGCLGDSLSIDLSDPNIVTYRWTLDGSSFDTGAVFSWMPINFWERAFVTVTDVNACEIRASRDFLKIQLDAYAPQVDLSLSPFIDFSFAVGPPSNASGFYWSFGDGDTSRSASVRHEYKRNDSYEYCLVVEYACGNDSSCNLLSINSVGINESSASNEIQLFPNPSSSTLNLVLDAELTMGSVRILDVQGRALLHFDHNPESMDLTGLAPGMYFVKVETATKQVLRAFVLE